MREGEPALLEVGAERRIGRRGDEQHEGRRHHVVDEARRGDLLGADAAADPVVALEHQHLAALAGRASPRSDERVDAASDDDVVGPLMPGPGPSSLGGMTASCFPVAAGGTSASARIGLPVPLTNLQRRGDQDRALRRQLVEVGTGWRGRSGWPCA